MEDPRKKVTRAHVVWFKSIYTDFLKDNKGYANPLDYIEGVYNPNDPEGNKEYWAKIARRAGHKCHKRKGVFYFEA